MAQMSPQGKKSLECKRCGRVFTPRNAMQVYCTRQCAYKFNQELVRSGANRLDPTENPAEADAFLRDHSVQNPETGCWEWTGKIGTNGRPVHRWKPHRLACELKYQKPLGSQPVHHKCGNVLCVSPEHMMPVTHFENVAEMLARNYFVKRISELEKALAEVDPDHALLKEIGVPSP